MRKTKAVLQATVDSIGLLAEARKDEIDRLREVTAVLQERIVCSEAKASELQEDNEILKNKVGDLVLQLEVAQRAKAGGLYAL